jgi:hypothetical protein
MSSYERQYQAPGTPTMMATSDIKRPIPENNATAKNWPLSDFPEAASAETGIDAATRAAFGMTGSPIHKQSEIPAPVDVWLAATKVQRNHRKNAPPGTEQHDQAEFRRIVLSRFENPGRP